MTTLITTVDEWTTVLGCAFCNRFHCKSDCLEFMFLGSVGVVLPTTDYTSPDNEIIPEEVTTSTTTEKEDDCYQELSEDEVSESRVVRTTSGLWNEKDDHEVFMNEVERWLRKKPGDWEEALGDAMVKYAELLISHPMDSFETIKDARAFYMQSIKNNRIDNDRKAKSFGKSKFQVISLNTSDEDNEVGCYDTYAFEYEVAYSESQKKTIQEVYEWDQQGSQNTLSKDNRKLYMRMNKLPVAEVENKKVVFIDSSKAIDLRDDPKTQRELSGEVVVRKQNQLEKLKAKTRRNRENKASKCFTHTITPDTRENASYVASEGSNEPDWEALVGNKSWEEAEPTW